MENVLSRSPIKIAPPNTLTMIFQLPIPVAISIAAPRRIAIADVSPTEPGIVPINISINEGSFVTSPAAHNDNGVAPEYPSIMSLPAVRPAVHTASPVIHAG